MADLITQNTTATVFAAGRKLLVRGAHLQGDGAATGSVTLANAGDTARVGLVVNAGAPNDMWSVQSNGVLFDGLLVTVAGTIVTFAVELEQD